VNKKCVVWEVALSAKNMQLKALFLAVSPQTRKFLLNLGYVVPEIYGDPALYYPDILTQVEKNIVMVSFSL
jgi:hypothetical protein